MSTANGNGRDEQAVQAWRRVLAACDEALEVRTLPAVARRCLLRVRGAAAEITGRPLMEMVQR